MSVERPSGLRDRAARLTASDWKAALAVAERIQDPWYACQATAFAAAGCPDPRRQVQLAQRAVDRAFACGDANRTVTVAAWPVKVLSMARHHREVRSILPRLLGTAATLASPVRRGHALDQLAGAVAGGPPDVLDTVLGPLFAACRTPLLGGRRNRRGIVILVRWIPFLEATRPGAAPHLEDAVIGSTYRWMLKQRRAQPREVRADASWLGPYIQLHPS